MTYKYICNTHNNWLVIKKCNNKTGRLEGCKMEMVYAMWK